MAFQKKNPGEGPLNFFFSISSDPTPRLLLVVPFKGLFSAPYSETPPSLRYLDFRTCFVKGQAIQNVNLFYICGFMIADGILLLPS